ncbi:hypothetical protein [Gracilibacillus saliphilus]|uniref:hypothetical protein n=1 Tax=Gracilibacillus saliphilus TaxID=543890 RepID=UPI0013D07003|nr:hypothetical protein [Gracilibacillus saliphilus]
MSPKRVEETQKNMSSKQLGQEQELTLEHLYSQIQQQQELLIEVLREIKKEPLPPQPSKSLFSILEKLDLDTEKLVQIAAFIVSLNTKNSKEEQDQKQELTLEQLHNQVQQQQELLNRVLQGTSLVPPQPPNSILEKINLDTEKLVQIATFIGGLYTNNNEDQDQI